MKISEILKQGTPTLSYEIFPPKTSDTFDSVMLAADKIADLRPSYMSVTYGAGGSTAGFSAEIAGHLCARGVTPLSHLTCIDADRETIKAQLCDLRSRGVENILALRGDLPADASRENLTYRHACDLMEEIRDFGGFSLGGACYPESHPESENSAADIEYLKKKADSGCEFLITQMFFDNNILYNFLYRAMKQGVELPVVAGIMPVTNAKQIRRICSISGTALPQRFLRIVERFGSDAASMKEAGIVYACEQIIDLIANGVNAVHVYSMNKPDVAAEIRRNLGSIVQ